MLTSTPPDLQPTGFGDQPRGLKTLFLTEMWERFSYYGMRALLELFMATPLALGGLGFAEQKASMVYGNYTMTVYLLSILGGYIADNFIGSRRAVLFGGIVIACGHYSMAIVSTPTFFLGLGLIAIGTGLLKPNISSMVGALYSPGDERRDAGFSIFYMGINLGALLSPFVTGWLAQSEEFRGILQGWGLDPRHSWHWGFAAAGVGMTLGIISYVARQSNLGQAGAEPASATRPWGKLAFVALATALMLAIMIASDSYPFLNYIIFGGQILAVLLFAFRSDPEAKRIAAILIFFMAAETFWAIFEQAGSSISLFCDHLTDNRIWHYHFPSSWYQSANPLFVILLSPMFAYLWIKWGSRQPSSPAKFVLGLAFLGLSFLFMVPAAHLTAQGKVSPLWLVGLFFLQTVGELCLSPVGLSIMTKLAPARLVGSVMGIWFLASALGNKLAGVLAGGFPSTDPDKLAGFFYHQALAVGAFTVVLLALVPWVKKLMGGVR